MPTCLYIRGIPGTGKRTVADILERDLRWPVLWVHHFDAVYKAIGEYKCPALTDRLMEDVAKYMSRTKRDFIIVRPSRDGVSIQHVQDALTNYRFIPIRLTASYKTLCTRVTRRWHESEFRITTKEALDEYLATRPESVFPSEHVIDTDHLTPEQVAGRIKELL
jgi:broad-specificity NMP kinase